MRLVRVVVSCSSLVVLAACGPPGAAAPLARTEITSAPMPLRSCDLPDERRDAPRFELDSAQLSKEGRETLARIAQCYREGRLGNAKLVIVGFTDPRGPSAYNRQLGIYRAIAARETLLELGVPPEAMTVISRGERAARGDDEGSWALDRRVEVRFADE